MASPIPPSEQKADHVREMFGRIARNYDLMNRLMTLGRDQTWRRYSVSQALQPSHSPRGQGRLGHPGDPLAAPGDGKWVLDVATGTGDLALDVLRQDPSLHVVGVDFVPQMLAMAQQKTTGAVQGTSSGEKASRLALTAGDALHLPFVDSWFDAVVTGFALRNVTDIPAAFAEMARVTRTGGRIACLEIAKPRLPVFRRLFALYFYRLVPLLGEWIVGEHVAYTYLPHSLTAFLTPDQIADVMRRTGWCEVSHQRLMMGSVAVHVGTRA